LALFTSSADKLSSDIIMENSSNCACYAVSLCTFRRCMPEPFVLCTRTVLMSVHMVLEHTSAMIGEQSVGKFSY